MKNHYSLLIILLSLSLVACSPRITRTEAFNTTANTAASTPRPTTSPQTPSTSTTTPVSLASTTSSTTFTDNPATFTHSSTLPTGTPPNIGNYPDYDSYLAAYYDHYGRDALNPPIPAVFSNQSTTTATNVISTPSNNQTVRPASLPTSPVSTPVMQQNVQQVQQPSTGATSQGTTTVFTTQPMSNNAYNHAISQANQAVAQANAALAQAAQAQQQVAPPAPTYTQPAQPARYNVTTATTTSSASSVASQGGTLVGTWQGTAVDNLRGTSTGTQFILSQRDNQLGGDVYFETVNGLEFFGQLQGRLAGNNATMTLRYQDGSYTYFTGDFGASFFTGEYQYVTSEGQSLASGTLRLRRQ